jgi:hypothetical protein
MARPPGHSLEVADVFRAHGAAWRKANASHVSPRVTARGSCRRSRPVGPRRSAVMSSVARTARTNASPTTPAATATARSVRALRRGNGSPSARPNSSRSPTSAYSATPSHVPVDPAVSGRNRGRLTQTTAPLSGCDGTSVPLRTARGAAASRLLGFCWDLDHPADLEFVPPGTGYNPARLPASTAKPGGVPPGRDGPDVAYYPVIVLLTRFTTSATFAPKASAVFKSPGIISSIEASEGETTTRPR